MICMYAFVHACACHVFGLMNHCIYCYIYTQTFFYAPIGGAFTVERRAWKTSCQFPQPNRLPGGKFRHHAHGIFLIAYLNFVSKLSPVPPLVGEWKHEEILPTPHWGLTGMVWVRERHADMSPNINGHAHAHVPFWLQRDFEAVKNEQTVKIQQFEEMTSKLQRSVRVG